MLWYNFFLKKSQMNLNNMKNFEYKQAVKSFSQIIKNDILNIINKQKKFNTFNINETLNVFFKAIKKSFAKIITALTQTCWQLIYYFKHFCQIRTVAFCKIKKNFYINSHFWKSIILLNIIKKIMKTITAKQIQKMTKKHNMLFVYQINAC